MPLKKFYERNNGSEWHFRIYRGTSSATVFDSFYHNHAVTCTRPEHNYLTYSVGNNR